MKVARVAKFLEFVGDCMPGVHELTLLVPAFFGLFSAAKALGLDMDWGPETVVVVSVTFSCFIWTILNSLTYRWPERLHETSHELPRPRHSPSANSWPRIPELNAGTQLEKKAASVNARQGHRESARQEKYHSPTLP